MVGREARRAGGDGVSRGLFGRLVEESQKPIAPAEPAGIAATVTLSVADIAKMVAPPAPPPPPPPSPIVKPVDKYKPRRALAAKATPSIYDRFRHLTNYVSARPIATEEPPAPPPPPQDTAKTLAAKMIAAARRGVAL